ncbi:MAG: hypothetical protein IJ042_03140, partial [Butyricicoccus sp.]|nr:hypothetical protein [Butyricicoccus sp.]
IGAPLVGAVGGGGIALILGLLIGVIALVFGGAVALAALPFALLVITLVTGLSTPIFGLLGTVMNWFIDLVHRLCAKLKEVLRR